MNNSLEKFVYSDKDLTLKEQADLVDKYLDMQYSMLWSTFPDLQLTRSGSVLYNDSSISVGDGVKVLLLGRKDISESIKKCSGCGRPHSQEIQEWQLERMIRDAKELVPVIQKNPDYVKEKVTA